MNEQNRNNMKNKTTQEVFEELHQAATRFFEVFIASLGIKSAVIKVADVLLVWITR